MKIATMLLWILPVALVWPWPVAAAAAPLAMPGDKALLTVHAEITGGGDQRHAKYAGQGTKWSTKRHLELQIELVAARPEKESMIFGVSAAQQEKLAALQQSSAEVEKELAKCPPDDMNCQMAATMKMTASPQMQNMMQAAQDTKKKASRYQRWQPAKDRQPQVKINVVDTWETVFFTAAKEVTSCTLTGPAVSPALGQIPGQNWEKSNMEQLDSGARTVVVEIDSTDGVSNLLPPVFGMYANRQCHENFGGQAEKRQDSENVLFFPSGWLQEKTSLPGTAATGEATIATGSHEQEVQHSLGSIGTIGNDGQEIIVPLQVKLTWQLKKM